MQSELLLQAKKNEYQTCKKEKHSNGGLDQWRKQKSLTYTLRDFPLSPQEAWSVPGPDAVGLPPRFFSLGSFYFIGMPFVFADPGIILKNKGTASFRGKLYDSTRLANLLAH